jgi:hypothetical protein
VTTAPAASRAPTERRVRHREHLGMAKAAGGVIVLVIIAVVSAAAAVHTISGIANPDTATRLQRYVDGKNHIAYTSSVGRFRAEFPSAPVASTEVVHVFIVIKAQRLESTVGNDSVEVVWFPLPPSLNVSDPQSMLATLSPFFARDLGGALVNGTRLQGVSPPAYEFGVQEPQTSRSGDYAVRARQAGHRVYLLRVQSHTSGVATRALHTFASTFHLR